MATLVAMYVLSNNCQLSSMQGFGMQRTNKNIYTQVKETERKCCHGNICCQVVSKKTGQLQSVLGHGMQRTYKNIYI